MGPSAYAGGPQSMQQVRLIQPAARGPAACSKLLAAHLLCVACACFAIRQGARSVILLVVQKRLLTASGRVPDPVLLLHSKCLHGTAARLVPFALSHSLYCWRLCRATRSSSRATRSSRATPPSRATPTTPSTLRSSRATLSSHPSTRAGPSR